MRYVVAIVLWLGAMGVLATAHPAGTILVSRNTDARENTTPGYWNHVAIMTGEHELVESRAGVGVVRTSWDEYAKRPYSRIIAIQPRDKAQGEAAAKRAAQLVGTPFRRLSSVARYEGPLRQSWGLNCVSLVKVAWRDVCPAFTRTHTPDAVVRASDCGAFTGVEVLR